VIPLQVGDLVLVASRVLGRDTDATLDLMDLEAAGAALAARPAERDADDPSGRAAALLHALVRRRPFQQANDEIALIATVQFVNVNEWHVDLDPPEATKALLGEIAAGTLGAAALADWLAPRLKPKDDFLDSIESCAKETRMPRWLPGRRQRERAMFTRFTDRARRAARVHPPEEARLLNHNYVGTEHLLLGLLREEEGVAAKALTSLGISTDAVRVKVHEIIGQGGWSEGAGDPAYTPRTKKVLWLSLREALQLGHNYIGTEHILLGLVREGEGLAAQVLIELGADLSSVRGKVIQLLSGYTGGGPPTGGGMDADTLTAENLRLYREIERLRGLLHEHGIEPDEGTSQSA
jgi:prophage maintenance system killer protein